MSETGIIKEQIELHLLQNGCKEFMYGWKDEQAVVQFWINGKTYRVSLDMPSKKAFEKTPTGRERGNDTAVKEWQKSQKDIWQALLNIVKTNFEYVSMGASTIEKQFLAYMVMPDGSVAGDFIEEMVSNAYRNHVKILTEKT